MTPSTPSRLIRGATAALASCALVAAPFTAASAASGPDPVSYSAADAEISLTPLGTHATGLFDQSAAEIVQYHESRLFVVNAQAGSVSILDASDPTNPVQTGEIVADGIANSVAVRSDGLGVIAVEANDKVSNGHLVFFDAGASAPSPLGTVEVGALPDMVALSPDGRYAVVANEGEPADDFSVDPEGSVSVVTLPTTVAAPNQDAVATADFHAFEEDGSKALPSEVRIFGPRPHGDDRPVSRNLEPEYVAISGGTAYVALQEANAFAVVDLDRAVVTDIHALGFKDHGVVPLDASDKSASFTPARHEGLYGMYQPDGIAAYDVAGTTYLVTANEGDAREWGDYEEPVRVKSLGKKGVAPLCSDSPLAALTADEQLGRLNVTRELGLDAERGCYSSLYAFGGRSFSIWTTDGTLVFDSGAEFEQTVASATPDYVNSNHTESNLKGRSDDKGPEPENLTIGTIGGRSYVFVGLERVGGVMAYDITDPRNARFSTYINNRDFSVSVESAADQTAALAQAGDLGPEGVTFIPRGPSGAPLLAVANEVSGTTTLFEITDLVAPPTTTVQILAINDFHGRIEQDLGGGAAGAAVLAGAVSQLRSENPHTVFVSAGDNIGASTFTSFIDDDNPTIDALAAAGLELSVVGNHEFDRGFADLTDRVLPRYGEPWYGLGANVYDAKTGEPALDEYRIVERDGIRIGFIGVVTEQTASMVSPDGIATLRFGDQLEAANRVAKEIDDLVDVTVLVTHDGSAVTNCADIASEDTAYGELVRSASPAIDAIVSGHTHQQYACEIEGRPVVQAGQYGAALGQVEITVDRATRDVVAAKAAVLPLLENGAPAYPADEKVAAIVAAASEKAESEGSKPAGRISADILRGGTPSGSDRGVESSLGNLIADISLWAVPSADIGLMNPGGLRADLRYGTDGRLTLKDVASVQPFANTVSTIVVTGAQLKDILEEQWQPAGSSRPKLHLGVSAGFSYEYREDAQSGNDSLARAAGDGGHIVSMTLHGEPIDPLKRYTIVTNSFLAAGGDNFVTFAEGEELTDTGRNDLQVTLEYFAAHDVVDPAPLGRAVLVTGTTPQPSPEPTVAPTTEPTPGVTSEPGEPSTAPGGGTETGGPALPETPGAEGELPRTGSEAPLGLALLAGLLAIAGAALVAMRRRARAE